MLADYQTWHRHEDRNFTRPPRGPVESPHIAIAAKLLRRGVRDEVCDEATNQLEIVAHESLEYTVTFELIYTF